MKALFKGLKNKTRVVTASLFITAATTSLAVYAGHVASVTVPGSILAQAVPVGVSTVQQMLIIIWSEFSDQPKTETSPSQPQKGNSHANA